MLVMHNLPEFPKS